MKNMMTYQVAEPRFALIKSQHLTQRLLSKIPYSDEFLSYSDEIEIPQHSAQISISTVI